GVTLFSENRIVLGRALATGSVAALAAASVSARGGMRLVWTAAAAIGALATFFSASRGAAFGLIAGAVIFYLLSSRRHEARWLLPAAAASIAGLLLVVVPDTDLATRYLSLVTPGADVTTQQRLVLSEAAIDSFVSSPIV